MILARNTQLKNLSTILEDGTSAASLDIGPRWTFDFSTIRGDGASFLSHDIGVRYATQIVYSIILEDGVSHDFGAI